MNLFKGMTLAQNDTYTTEVGKRSSAYQPGERLYLLGNIPNQDHNQLLSIGLKWPNFNLVRS